MKKHLAKIIFVFALSLTSCDSEKALKGLMFGMEKMMGGGFFPSEEILALGEFERSEVNVKKEIVNGVHSGRIELRLYNGKSDAYKHNEESTARECADLYVKRFSKIEDYQEITIYFIQTDPLNMENIAITEYMFEVEDFL
ncbi:hypothetical protein ACFSKL_12865 [Belliella marina]|uniref:Lipoprotein n=1 Tax=Belliella marina TaxID=1644146 RepID=A0ABW4VLS4_9BACT